MILEATILALALFAGLAVPHLRRRQKYLLTMQKVVNANQQPETLTIQCNLPAGTKPEDAWEEAEHLGLIGVSRMQSINAEILATNKEIAAEIEKRKARVAELKQKFKDKQLRRAARQFGCRVDELNAEMIERLTAVEPDDD